MDDPRLAPSFLARLLPFAWSTAAGPPTRTRPSRPIAFTPTRGEPIAPPPGTRPPAPGRSAAARLSNMGVRLLVAAGWIVFVAWWAIVLRRERIPTLAGAVGVLAVLIVLSAVLAMLWAAYNARIARRGRRGSATRDIPMHWERDTLGRPLVLPGPAIAQTAAEVRIIVRDGTKAYIVEREAQP